jgi:homoserine/homoserine lactone efflux protein
MTILETWGVFAVTETALCLTPGPALLFVLSQGLRHGGAKPLWANAGILAGNGIYFTLSVSGLGAVLAASHKIFVIIKWTGAAYLLFSGVRAFFEREGFATWSIAGSGGLAISGRRLFARGLATQLANPKALIFFTALLPQFINTKDPIFLQALLLGITGEIIEFLVLSGYGFLSGGARKLACNPMFLGRSPTAFPGCS